MDNFDKSSPDCCVSCINALLTSPIQGRQIMLNALIEAGASISVELGQVNNVNQEGFQITELSKNLDDGLTKEILELLQIDAFSYTSYSVGNYDQKYPGLTLQFSSIITGESYYVIFNVEITRIRTTKSGKRGQMLPAGHFRVGKRSLFCSFWHSTQLKFPARLSAFHDYLGNLRNMLFTAEEVPNRPGRLSKQTLRPLSVPAEVISARLLADTSRTSAGQLPDNRQTSVPDRSLTESLKRQAFEGGSATGGAGYGKAVIRMRGYEGTGTTCQHKRPEEQTEEEWLADFCNPPNAGN